MKPGHINFLASQAEYQWTPNLTFVDRWYKKPAKITEKFLMRVIVISFLMTILGHCLLSYTRW